MKILITTEFYYPYVGGSIFLQKVAEGLVKKGHDVIVATAYLPERKDLIFNGVKIEQFKIKGNAVKGMRGEIDRYKNFLLGSQFDSMLNFAANIWTSDIPFELADRLHSKKFLTTPGLSRLGKARYHDYYHNLYLNAVKKYEKIIYTSFHYQDKIFGDRHGIGDKAVLIPNGAGNEFLNPTGNFRQKYGIKTSKMAVSISNHYLKKGHWFVIRAFLKLRRPDATLVLIGNRPGSHPWYSCYLLCNFMAKIHPRIKSFSNVPREDAVSAFAEADLYLFGSKVECAPLVLYESFASKTPFITTDVGNVKDYRDYIKIIKSPSEMAKVANDLLNDETIRHDMAERAFQLWRKNYTWDKIVDLYERILTIGTLS